ncbi:TIGR03086 family protein [Nocardioides alpinus]|uniref:TIGR03086 family protein n=1 Tax=Nocardioides alpinus TaxID=748909 RepID=A0A1I0XYN8_9ACTN|nr:TIGR03086 family metal-binding protein [Nocardioides alpinus]PKH42791.1 TIGR03086 family protein [Nocardioides alpinus]SFB05430.1 TIGR03086 family protein [Nocardioides alpinus]
MTETSLKFTERADVFATIVGRAWPAWDAPTPCEAWTVRDVVDHVIDTEREFLKRQDLGPGPSPDRSDPVGAWRQHAAAVAEVLARDGVADTEYDGWFGRTTIAATMADFYGWDLVVHGSDIARATGQEWTISDEEATQLHTTADGWGDALYSEGICREAVEVSDDASASDRLLARLGRDPGWRPEPVRQS